MTSVPAAPIPPTAGSSLVTGLDVGTTFTGAAVVRNSQPAEAVPLGRQRTVMPTAVWLGAEGEVQVGEAAVRRLGTDPDRVARLFKRGVGSDRPVPVGDANVPVERLLAEVIRTALDAVHTQYGVESDRVALTFPASWGPYRQGILVDGARQCGVENPLLVTEPEAAAAFYSTQRDVADGSLVAVFDFGGGTLDVAVVHKVPGGFELLGNPKGDDTLGGASIDTLVIEHVADRLRGMGVEVASLDPQARLLLERECIEAKEALSFDDLADVPVALPGGHQLLRLERPEFEQLIAPLVERSHEVLLDALAAADVAPGELTAVLLVGGTSRIPLIASMLRGRFSCEVAVNADPKNSVCLGAAQLAAASPTGSSGSDQPSIELGIPGLADPVLIGSGGYSMVYKARQVSFDRDVAVKVVTGGGFDLTARRQFERECRTIGRLSEHPNIVTVFDSGVPADGAPYLVMAHLAGGSLQDRLADGQAYGWQEALDVTMKIGDALEQAHEAGIVHCDVKPANILVSARAEPQLADFGLARVAERTGTQSIMGLVGTPHYSPPELFDGVAPAPTRDIYSLAATTHALMSGQPPIGAGSTNVLSLMRQVVSDAPSDLRPFGVPDGVATVLEKALDKDPSARPQSMADFLAALRVAADGGDVNQALFTAPSPAVPSPAVPPPAAAPVSPVPGPLGPGPTVPPRIDSTMELRSALPFDEASGEMPTPQPAPVTEDVLQASEAPSDVPPMASGDLSAATPSAATPSAGAVPPTAMPPADVAPSVGPPSGGPPSASASGPPPSSGEFAQTAEPGPIEKKRSRLPLLIGAGAVVIAALAGGAYAATSRATVPTTTVPTTAAADGEPSSDDPLADDGPDEQQAEPGGGSSTSTEPGPAVVTGFEEVASFAVGEGPWTAASGIDDVWVPVKGGVVRIDLATSELQTTAIAGWSETPLVTEDSVWVPNISEPTVTRIDRGDPTAEPATIAVGQRGFTPVLANGAVWVPNRDDNTISRVEVETNEVSEIDLGVEGVSVAEVDGDVWVSTAGGLFVLDAAGEATRISDFIPRGAAVAAQGSGWVVEAESGNLLRIDPATGRVQLVDVGGGASSLTPGEDALWFIADSAAHRLDLDSFAITDGPTVEGPSLQLSPAVGGAWLTTRAEAPMLYFLDDGLEIVSQLELPGVPDAPVVVGDRMFVSLTRDGATVLEFRTLAG